MAIIINIDVMLAKRKMSVTGFADSAGVTISNISVLKNGRESDQVIDVGSNLQSAGMSAWRHPGNLGTRPIKLNELAANAESSVHWRNRVISLINLNTASMSDIEIYQQ